MNLTAPDATPPERRAENDQADADPDAAGEDADIFPTVYHSVEEVADVEELAEAERAAARNAASPDQAAGVAAAGQVRRAEDRLERWQGRHGC